MNFAIEMHDSEFLAVETDESGTGSILLRAYVHRSSGKPGHAPGDGGVQNIRMVIESMTGEGEAGDLPSYIYEGSLAVGFAIQDNMVPFPAKHLTNIRLTMMLSEDARVVTYAGSSILIEATSDFEYVEDFPL